MGLIAGVTDAIDSHHGVMAEMGPRFMRYRLPPVDAQEQARRALFYAGYDEYMQESLRSVVSGFFEDLDAMLSNAVPRPLTAEETDWLVALTEFATRCRSAVERHPYTRDIPFFPQPEAPARLTRSAVAYWLGWRS
jgi:hypothetical protein